MTHPNPDPLRSALEINPDLVERCKELLQWGRTGLLNNGSGGAVRALAKSLEQSVGAHQAMSVAEFKTRDEAMSEVVRIAALASPQGRETVIEEIALMHEAEADRLEPKGSTRVDIYEHRTKTALLHRRWANRVRALKSSAPDAWRPIETAPKDTDVLLGWWRSWPERQWESASGLAGSTKGGWLHGQATHWQPLPAPPAEKI